MWLFPKGLNWVQHWVSRIGLFVTHEKSQYFYSKAFFKGVQRTLWSSIFFTLKIDVLQTRLYGHLLNIRTPHSYKPPRFSKEKSVQFPSLPVYSCLKLKLTYNAIVNQNALFPYLGIHHVGVPLWAFLRCLHMPSLEECNGVCWKWIYFVRWRT